MGVKCYKCIKEGRLFGLLEEYLLHDGSYKLKAFLQKGVNRSFDQSLFFLVLNGPSLPQLPCLSNFESQECDALLVGQAGSILNQEKQRLVKKKKTIEILRLKLTVVRAILLELSEKENSIFCFTPDASIRIHTPLLWQLPCENKAFPPHSAFQTGSSLTSEYISCSKFDLLDKKICSSFCLVPKATNIDI